MNDVLIIFYVGSKYMYVYMYIV